MSVRLQILDNGHGFSAKALFAVIRAFSGQPALDVVKLVKYRADFYGDPMSSLTHEAMRGPSAWSVGERELMAAFVAKSNRSSFCTKTHTMVAQMAFGDGKILSALLSDLDAANLAEPLRATLHMLGDLTRENTVDAKGIRAVLSAGASRQQIEDALAVCFCFNVIARLSEAFGFHIPDQEAFEAGARFLLTRGYR